MPRRRHGAPKAGVVTDVIPEGGHQDPNDYEGMHLSQTMQRESPRCMYPDEFLSVLRQHRHPRWPTIGVAASDRFNRERESETIMGSCGTVYVAGPYEKRVLFAIPCNCIPYSSIKTATWNDKTNRWENGALERGWRGALKSLVSSTYLAPSAHLSWLIGENTYQLFPIEARP